MTQLSLRAYLQFLFHRTTPLCTDTSCEGQRRETKAASATTARAEAVVDVAVLTQAQFPIEGGPRMVEVCESHADKVVEVPRCSHDAHSTCVEFSSRVNLLDLRRLFRWSCEGFSTHTHAPPTCSFDASVRVSSFAFVRLCWARKVL